MKKPPQPPSKITYTDLLHVEVRECREPFVDLRECAAAIDCLYQKQDMVPYIGDAMPVRARVAEQLLVASMTIGRIDPAARLLVVYGWRHPDVQRRYHESAKTRLRLLHPGISEEELTALAHVQGAVPALAGHPTGGAVDLTITMNGKPVDMGTPIANWSQDMSRMATRSPGLTFEQRLYRTALRAVMVSAGFAPYDEEWWHFSLGDREWALTYQAPFAMYGPVEIPSISSIVFDEA